MAIFMIGSTGNGKSTLGNFLLNPEDDHLFRKQTFVTARSNMPQTHHVKAVSADIQVPGHGKATITVIDTPGLNESAVKNLEHMICLIDEVKTLKNIKACIIVLKFNSKIDTQYKATVKYYSELLPDLFERNVVVVMTDFANDARSVTMREKQGIDVEKVKENTIKEIKKCSGMTYEPAVFAMDCLPFDSEEREANLVFRKALLEYILSLTTTKVSHLQVAKTEHVRQKDNEKKKELEGKIIGYNERLQEADQKAKVALTALEAKESEVTGSAEKLEGYESDLQEKNTDDMVVANSWFVNREWQLLRPHVSTPFTVPSHWKIVQVDKWTNGECHWKDYTEDPFCVRGKLEGKFIRGIYATLTLLTTKKLKYETTIKQLNTDAKKERDLLEKLQKECDEICNEHKEHEATLKLLHDYIAQKREEIKTLSGNFMTIDEARKRLRSMMVH